ncbi:hypothetical protein HJC23_007549 [Cyclotella cryptica]|uniref:Fibronectin type-III domain-containing protein n=1 Tax=Cyclotella cryptica TaxID=29204 RepID=A0ABD3QR91_9STRA
MKLRLLLPLASLHSTRAFVEPESTFGALLIQAVNATGEDGSYDTAFYGIHEIPLDESSGNLFESGAASQWDGATFDARSGKLANVDLRDPILPGGGEGNSLLWTVGFADSADGHAKPQDVAEWQAIAVDALQNWITLHQAELKIDPSELFLSSGHEGDTSVSTAVHNDGDMIQFSLQRTFKGLVVQGSRASATIKGGNLVNVGFENGETSRVISMCSLDEAYRALSQSTGNSLSRGETCKPELQILTQTVGETPEPISANGGLRSKTGKNAKLPEFGKGYTHSLVWKVCPKFEGQTVEMFEAYVDAKTSSIHSIRDTVEYFQAKGDIYPTSNDGNGLDGVLQPDWPMPFSQVGSEVTDTGGNYFKSGNQVAYLYGPYVKMSDKCGTGSLTQNGGIDWGGAGYGGDCNTPGYGGKGNTHASRSGFYELNKIKEIARSHLPSNAWLKGRLLAVMNIKNTCNAFYNGNVNFYRKGNGCGNTGEIAAIFDHEWGHGMDQYDVASGISKPSGEGIADIYSALRLNDSCIGRGFFLSAVCSGNGNPCLSCSGVRDIDYMKRKNKTPSTYSWAQKQCNNQVHCMGYVYSEAVWSLYKRKLQSSPYNYDDNTALEIVMRLTFIAAGNVGTWFSGSTPFGGCGTSSGYRQYLLADDDDGNLNNGTPHMQAIYSAFNDQEIACSSPPVQDSGCAGTPNLAPIVTSAAGDMRATLNWNAVGGASKYQVFRTEGVKGCSQGKVLLATLSSNTLTFTDAGLQNGREYYYIVIGKGSNPACFGPASSCATVIPSATATTPSPSTRPTSNPTPNPTNNTPSTSSPTTRPTSSGSSCGDGVCERQTNEDPQTCPNDCIVQQLTLGSSSNGNAKAVMFTATAIDSVSFASFGVVGKKNGDTLVEVYTRLGDYSGAEQNPNAWEHCFSNNVQLLKNRASNIASIENLTCDTHTPSGTKRSFHVYVKNGILIQRGVMNSSNTSLKVDNGIFLKDKFKQAKGQAVVFGEVR